MKWDPEPVDAAVRQLIETSKLPWTQQEALYVAWDTYRDHSKRFSRRGKDEPPPKTRGASPSELLARTNAVLRRARGTSEPSRLEIADIVLDRFTREVTRDGKKIDLQPREFALLEQLMRNEGKALSKSFLLEKLWDYSFDPQTNVVDVLVCRLRNKIDKDFSRKLIYTMRGVGYVLRAK